MSLRNKTIAEALREGKQRLRSAGKDAYAVEAELLLEKAVGLNRTALFLRGEEPLSAEAAMQYEGFLAERESGRPTQYILGTWEFMEHKPTLSTSPRYGSTRARAATVR